MPPFQPGKIGHVAPYVSNIERSTQFYTGVLGFDVSDCYGDDMMPGGAVFLRCNRDHHGIALFKTTETRRRAGMQIAVEFRDPDDHRLEICWGIDKIAPGEQARPVNKWKGARSLEAAIADPVAGQDTRLNDPGLLAR